MSENADTPWYACAAWVAVLLSVAIVTVGTQLDFVTRTHPEFAELVPEPFRAHAYAPLARTALEGNRGEEAKQLAQSLVRERPIPAESASLLSIAAQTLNDTELASQALGASAARGWRDPTAQIAVIYAALYERDWQMLAERVDAMYRTGHSSLVPFDVIDELLATDEGRHALAQRLTEGRSWLGQFLNMGRAGDIDPAIFGKTMLHVHSLGAKSDCIKLAAVARSLLSRGEVFASENVWKGHCATLQGQTISGFTDPNEDKPSGPFEWVYPSVSGLQRSFAISNGFGALNFRHSDGINAVLAERFFKLERGAYSIRLSADTSLKGSRVFFRLDCVGGGPTVIAKEELEGVRTFVVPSNCLVQQLRLAVTKGRGEKFGLHVDRLSPNTWQDPRGDQSPNQKSTEAVQ